MFSFVCVCGCKLTPHFSYSELGKKMYSDTGGIRVPTSKNLSGKKVWHMARQLMKCEFINVGGGCF